MLAADNGDITVLLHRWKDGDVQAENELFCLVLPDLQRFAHYLLKGEQNIHSLRSGDLLNQIYFKLVAAKNRDWQSRRHFFAIAARAMRRYLIDYIRSRGNEQFVQLPELEALLRAPGTNVELAITVNKLLDDMAQTDPDLCSVAEMKLFSGMTDKEGADALGLSLRTFQRMWQDARILLFERL